MTYPHFFADTTDNNPYLYQERVATTLLRGKNLILRAPTGTGKTLAVVAPFLFGIKINAAFADRLLYALPLRSLASSLCAEVQRSVICSGLDLDVRLQTGEQKNDPFFEADITFTTIDQLLSGYLLNPLSLPRRVGNINAGALIGSLIVFDEYHLLEPTKSMATSIEMLDRLVCGAPLAQFVIMTVTLASETIQLLARKLNAETIELSASEVAALPSHRDKRRTYRWVAEPLTADHVIANHNGGRSIVLLNTVDRAQQMYLDLCSESNRQRLGVNTEIALLHSRFFPEDRRAVEEKLMNWFGPEPGRSDVVLVTTQVIEAGMDLSADQLHTEVAPVNALIQRAGRCARRRGGAGTVWIYELEKSDSGKPRYGPYRENSHLVDVTCDLLKTDIADEGRICHYHDELAWVDAVHTKQELAELERLSLHDHRKRVHAAMDGENPNAARELVRDVSSVNVIITSRPEDLRFDKRKWPRFLSVPQSSLFRLREHLANVEQTAWVLKRAVERDVQQSGRLIVDWGPVDRLTNETLFSWLVAVHPNYAAYDPKIGLRLGAPGTEYAPHDRERPQMLRFCYAFETYEHHIQRVLESVVRGSQNYVIAQKRLADCYKVSTETIDNWVRLVSLLHDVGKLSIKWQEAIWAWQDFKDNQMGINRRDRPPLAHSDYDPATDWQDQRSYVRPPHAAEGACAIVPVLKQLHDAKVARTLFTAIARHHGTWTRKLSDFELPESAIKTVLKTAGHLISDCQLTRQSTRASADQLKRSLLEFSDSNNMAYWPLYVFLSRRLRLADQAATKESQQ